MKRPDFSKLDFTLIFVGAITLLYFVYGILEGYFMGYHFLGTKEQIAFIYETDHIGVPITLSTVYVILLVKYNKVDTKFSFMIKRLYIPIGLLLLTLSYLLGLNFAYISGLEDSIYFEFIVPNFILVPSILLFIGANIWLYSYSYKKFKSNRILNIYTVVLVIIGYILFNGLLTDTMYDLNVFYL